MIEATTKTITASPLLILGGLVSLLMIVAIVMGTFWLIWHVPVRPRRHRG